MSFLTDPIKFIIDWVVSLLYSWGLSEGWITFLTSLVGGGVIALLAMFFVIFLIWYERKLIGRIQDRLGPNRVGPFGLIQPFADMIKIFAKELITPAGADWLPYNLAPVLSVAAVLMIWAVIPFTITVVGTDLNVGLLYLIASGGFAALSVLFAGWSSNNKFALLGGFRALAQLISYEVPMLLALLVPVMLAGSLSVAEIVTQQKVWFVLSAPVSALIFLITSVAEIGRAPFDLVEAESELVAGFNTEYSGLKFGMFYVAEFLHAFTAALLFSTLYLGGWRGPFAEEIPILGFVYLVIKTFIVYFIFILFRGSLPRFRIDQMMDLNWKILTPLALSIVILSALVDKALTPAGMVVRVAGLLVLNIITIVVTSRLIDRSWKRRKREIVTAPRPVAIANPGKPESQESASV